MDEQKEKEKEKEAGGPSRTDQKKSGGTGTSASHNLRKGQKFKKKNSIRVNEGRLGGKNKWGNVAGCKKKKEENSLRTQNLLFSAGSVRR